MNEGCLSFEDMLELLTAEEMTNENRSRLFSINTHLIRCKSCGEKYRKLVKLYDIVESWSLPEQYAAEQKLQHMKTCHSLLYAQKKAPQQLANRIQLWLRNFVYSSAKISLKIKDGIKLTVDKACSFVSDTGGMNFDYAMLPGVRGGGMQVDESVLIDEGNSSNKIKIEKQKSITISLAATADIPPLIAIVPSDSSTAAIVKELAYESKNGLWHVRIDNLLEGEYDILIEKQGE